MAYVVTIEWTARHGEADAVAEAIDNLIPRPEPSRVCCSIRLTATPQNDPDHRRLHPRRPPRRGGTAGGVEALELR
jgi:hypothetical protein